MGWQDDPVIDSGPWQRDPVLANPGIPVRDIPGALATVAKKAGAKTPDAKKAAAKKAAAGRSRP